MLYNDLEITILAFTSVQIKESEVYESHCLHTNNQLKLSVVYKVNQILDNQLVFTNLTQDLTIASDIAS